MTTGFRSRGFFIGLDHRFGQFPTAGRPRQGVFGRAAGCLSDSEFLPVWKKYPGVADTMIKAFLFNA
ncbi:MAG: hypothetical protein V2B19_10210 [Pseudomonadota bacterium]